MGVYGLGVAHRDAAGPRDTRRNGNAAARKIRPGGGCRTPVANLGGPELNNLLRDISVISVKSSVSCRAAARRNGAPALNP
jgi:hypothetical protein